jgi:hypothetical protein
MTANPALENATHRIGRETGILRVGDGPDPEIMRLAETVGMADEVLTRPIAVAHEITRYLDDIVRTP